MSHAIFIRNKTVAKNIDAYVRNAKASMDLDNGDAVILSGISAVAGEGEVFIASTPATASPTGVWFVAEPEVVVTNGQYKGLDPDPRNFYVKAGDIFTVNKAKIGDIVTFTAPAFSNTRTTEIYIDTAAGTSYAWASTQTSATIGKLLGVTAIPLPAGQPGQNRVTSYKVEIIAE